MIKKLIVFLVFLHSILSNRGMLYLLLMLSFCPTIDSLQAFEAKPRVDKFIEGLSNNKYQPQRFDGDLEPKQIPDLKKDKETLLGIDSDRDGVRDDLEIFVNRNFTNDYERIVLKNLYKTASELMKLNLLKDSKNKIRDIKKKFDESDDCFRYLVRHKISDAGVFYRTENSYAYFFNTPARDSHLGDIMKLLIVGGSEAGTTKELYDNCPKQIKVKYPWREIKSDK